MFYTPKADMIFLSGEVGIEALKPTNSAADDSAQVQETSGGKMCNCWFVCIHMGITIKETQIERHLFVVCLILF